MSDARAVSGILARLGAGNARYVAEGGKPTGTSINLQEREPTSPLAAIIVCSDQKASPEQVFGLVPGELYVMQTAANLVGDGEAAGTALARASYDVELVIVLGHSPCRVIDACETEDESTFGSISRELYLSRAKLQTNRGGHTDSGTNVARTHASRMAEALREKLSDASGIPVVAAYLDEGTGEVEFL